MLHFASKTKRGQDVARGTTIIGLAKLQKKLDRLPKVAKDHIREKMAEAAQDIVDEMESRVPYREGTLHDSIAWTWGKAPKGAMTIASLKSKIAGDLTLTIYAGGGDAYHVRWVEFGTVKMPAQPFFYVSWRDNRRPARNKVLKAVRDSARQVAAGR